MSVLCFCVSVPSTPSDGDSSRPEEDTFGVSFLLNDVDETAAKDEHRAAVSFNTNI